MNEMFDPNAGAVNAPDLMQQGLNARRQRALADMLRKQVAGTQAPQGEMVSGRYVAPSIFQHLNNAFQQYSAGRAESGAQKGEDALAQATGRAQQNWQSSLPQATAATTKPYMAPGIDGDEAIGQTNVPAQPVTTERMLKAALAGRHIPGNEGNADLYLKTALGELTREDNQTFKTEERTANERFRQEESAKALAQAKELKYEQLEMQRQTLESQMLDKDLSRGSLDAFRAMHDKTLRYMAELDANRANRESGNRRDDMKARQTEQNVEHISRRAEPIVPMLQSGQQVQDMLDNYKDPKTGKYKDIPGIGLVVGSLPGAMLTTEGSTNRQKLQMFANAITRAQAGLSQTLSEQEKVELELMKNGKFRQGQFLAVWPSILGKVNATQKAITAGYNPEVVDIFNKTRSGGLEIIGPRTKPPRTSTTLPSMPLPGGAPRDKVYNPATGRVE